VQVNSPQDFMALFEAFFRYIRRNRKTKLTGVRHPHTFGEMSASGPVEL